MDKLRLFETESQYEAAQGGGEDLSTPQCPM